MTFNLIFSFAAALLCGGLAVFVFFKARRSFVHQVFAVGMIALAAEAVLNGLSFLVSLPSEIVDWQLLRHIATAFVPVGWLLFSLSFGRASYKEMILKWRWHIIIVLAIPIALATLFGNSIFKGSPVFDTPSRWSIPLGWSGYLFYLTFLLSTAIIIMNLERTLRNSSGSIRWQIKFMILGLGGIFAVRIYTSSQVLLFHYIEMPLEVINLGTLILGSVLIIWSLLRLRLLNVDIYLSHSLIYNSITIVVIGIYLILIGILAKVASYLNISQAFLIEALFVFLALLGLTVILLSGRLRHGIKRFVNLHFRRPKYDYRMVWTSFTHRTASLISMNEVCAAVTKMVAETFDVACVTIWLVDESQENLSPGGSTVFSSTEARELIGAGKMWASFIQMMRSQQSPIDFDQSEMDWARELKQSYSEFFDRGRIRYAISLLSGNELLGIMTLNEKLTKENFSLEDFDLLEAIADQAAVSILNIKMSERLSRAKEMEAFQTMSAFFVHDLKNLASKLSLTMQNLPVHFDNPEFRSDALGAISDSVNKINAMCSGLSLLRQKIVLKPVEADLNELVTSTLNTLNGCKASIAQDLKPLPKFLMDSEQIQKVLTNLILNANEALGNGGEIRISTEQIDGWIVLSVSDNGCGMSKDFIENSLFRPFKTTKKQGMGIGLFHSKMIVQAHQGRIEVESEVGKGTTLKVILPIKGCRG
jgi:putative PEP-CTERM system histidine kinase